MITIEGSHLTLGTAEGQSMLLEEPLSFWGGVDPATGEIIDRHHPQSGLIMTGSILMLRHGRGSSGTPSVLVETVRKGVGPVGIILQIPDPMFVVGSFVIAELYPSVACPVVTVGNAFDDLINGAPTRIEDDGTVRQTD